MRSTIAPSSQVARRGRLLALRILLLTIAAALSGCQFSAAPQRAAAPAGPPRSGEVFLIRGLLGIFSTGMDQLQGELSRQGVRAVALQHSEGASAAQWIIDHYDPSAGPLILVGHSLGADEAVAVARRLERARVPVDLLITLDPVTADPIPSNVRQAANYYRPGAFDVVPALRGIPLKTRSGSPAVLYNVDLNEHPELLEPGINHFSIDNNPRVQRIIVEQILSVCPPESDSPRAVRASMTLSPVTPERP